MGNSAKPQFCQKLFDTWFNQRYVTTFLNYERKKESIDMQPLQNKVKSLKGLARGKWSAGVLYCRRRKQKNIKNCRKRTACKTTIRQRDLDKNCMHR
jgi:hypothetical protein